LGAGGGLPGACGTARPRAGGRRGGGAGGAGALPVPGGGEVLPRPARRARARGRQASPADAAARREVRAGAVARIVIAGAGAIGASIAYQLALRGADDVVLADDVRVAAGA